MKYGAVFVLLFLVTQASCVVGGYSSERGWFVWPGSLVITAVFVALLLLLLRRRRR